MKRDREKTGEIPEIHRKNLEDVGLDEEKWYRIWYDLYHNSIGAVNPAHPSILKHYTNIPQKYIAKFMKEAYRKTAKGNNQ